MNRIIREFFMALHHCGKINNRGYVLLMSVLILGAVGIAITVSLLLFGTGNLSTLNYWQKSTQAKAITDGCTEEALQQIRDNSSYSGTVTTPVGSGSCTYAVENLGGNNRSVSVSGTDGIAVRRVSILIDQLNPQLNIAFWREN